MNIAIISGGVCANAAVFSDLASAEEFLTAGVWESAEAVVELPEGYGIGDGYADGVWSKAEQDLPSVEEPEATPTQAERIEVLEATNRQQAARIVAQGESLMLLEECLVEMAGIVYA